jgi:transcriptional regulator with XRE-family HTH domain
MINLDLKILMLQRGVTYKGIANKLGVSRKTVAVVASGFSTSKRIQAALAEAVGKSVQELWPDKEKAGGPQQCVNE